MNLFSISQLARFSGIKPHTIRMWEQRYGALQPTRSEGNTRYYDGNQLRRLLNIVSLTDSDYKVSELCRMPDKKLNNLIQELNKFSGVPGPEEYFISQLIAAGISYDESHFDKIFSHCLMRFGVKETYTRVIYPMLNRTGVMWSIEGMHPGSEHFITNLVRQKLSTAIDMLPPARTSSDPWLLFLPENELHEIGLMMAHFLIRQAGHHAIYLGSNLPLESLTAAIEIMHPSYLMLFMVHRDDASEIQLYLDEIYLNFKGKKIFVAADKTLTDQVKIKNKILFVNSVETLEQEIKSLK